MHFPAIRRFIGVLALSYSAVAASAQPDYFKRAFEHKKDSLVKELSKRPTADTTRVRALIKILDLTMFLSERKEVLPYWTEAIHLSRKLNFGKGLAACLEWKGSYYKAAHQIDSAFLFLDSAIEFVDTHADPWLQHVKGFALFQKGVIYETQENLYTALNAYFTSLKTYNNTDPIRERIICHRIATIYKELHNDASSLEYYQQELVHCKKAHGNNAEIMAEGIYLSIAGIYFDRGELSEAGSYLGKLAPFMPDTVETIITGGYYQLAGNIAEKEGKAGAALGFLKEAVKYFGYTREVHANDVANACAGVAHLDILSGQLSEAGKYAGQSLEAARESGQKQAMANSLITIAEYYNKTGRQSDAYQALLQATVLNDSVLTAANIRQANTLSAIYENGKKERAIAQLEADKKVQQASVKQEALLNIIFIITILSLLLLGVVLWLNVMNKRKLERQRISELEKEKQLMGIEAMLKGQEEERSRLAKDLHDGLGSMLSGVKISFSNMKENVIMDATNTHAFERSVDQLDKTITELRKIAHNLMPVALVKFGLRSAIKDFCESIRSSGNTDIICEQFGSERPLGNIADINVYRIIQELVNNAVLHGQAKQILVQLTKTDERVLITVEDNGNGFELNSLDKVSGIGMANIRSRVNYFNGRMDIESKPNEGTTVNIELIA